MWLKKTHSCGFRAVNTTRNFIVDCLIASNLRIARRCFWCHVFLSLSLEFGMKQYRMYLVMEVQFDLPASVLDWKVSISRKTHEKKSTSVFLHFLSILFLTWLYKRLFYCLLSLRSESLIISSDSWGRKPTTASFLWFILVVFSLQDLVPQLPPVDCLYWKENPGYLTSNQSSVDGVIVWEQEGLLCVIWFNVCRWEVVKYRFLGSLTSFLLFGRR
jgi:hypothetical protein